MRVKPIDKVYQSSYFPNEVISSECSRPECLSTQNQASHGRVTEWLFCDEAVSTSATTPQHLLRLTKKLLHHLSIVSSFIIWLWYLCRYQILHCWKAIKDIFDLIVLFGLAHKTDVQMYSWSVRFFLQMRAFLIFIVQCNVIYLIATPPPPAETSTATATLPTPSTEAPSKEPVSDTFLLCLKQF